MDNKNFHLVNASSPTLNKKIINFDNQKKSNYSSKNFQNEKLKDYRTGCNQNYHNYNTNQNKQAIYNFNHNNKNRNYDNNFNNININYYQNDNQEFLHRKKHFENKIYEHHNKLELKNHIRDDTSKNQESRNHHNRNQSQTFYNNDKLNLNLKEEFNDPSKVRQNHNYYEKTQNNEFFENSNKPIKIKNEDNKEFKNENAKLKSYSEHKSNSNQFINNIENSYNLHRSVCENTKENSRITFSNSKNSVNADRLVQDFINKKNKDIIRDELINTNNMEDYSESKEQIINKNLNSKHLIDLEFDDLTKNAKEYCLIQKINENKLEMKKSSSNLNFSLIQFTTQEEEQQRISRENKYSNQNRTIKNISNYQKIEEIGEGTYGRVCKYK